MNYFDIRLALCLMTALHSIFYQASCDKNKLQHTYLQNFQNKNCRLQRDSISDLWIERLTR